LIETRPRWRLLADPAVLQRFPGYSARVVYAYGLSNAGSGGESSAILAAAEAEARRLFAGGVVAAHPHIEAWRAAYSAFGSKPSRYLCSAEALLRRALKGEPLPRINRFVDVYNAVSLRHVLPAGGEDLDRLEGDLRLAFATGAELFDAADPASSDAHPDPNEVVWKDPAGVTCRRWNWRQCRRTRLVPETVNAYFVLDRLAPFPVGALEAAAQELRAHVSRLSPACEVAVDSLGAP
jgi:DNA/RNA-binding domain of Phe-tRNA-synthetase-like protein